MTKLYSTKFCHLCDQAELILQSCKIEVVIVDITEDEELSKKYGMRIPVLKRLDSDAELDWPFDTVTVLRFTHS